MGVFLCKALHLALQQQERHMYFAQTNNNGEGQGQPRCVISYVYWLDPPGGAGLIWIKPIDFAREREKKTQLIVDTYHRLYS